eukprot:5727221-Alexandrium_andersonii.AAC.1
MGLSVVMGNIRPSPKGTGKIFPVRAIIRHRGTDQVVEGIENPLVPGSAAPRAPQLLQKQSASVRGNGGRGERGAVE